MLTPVVSIVRMPLKIYALFILFCVSMPPMAQTQNSFVQGFTALYEQELGSVNRCSEQTRNEVKICSKTLRNDGNAPFALMPSKPKGTVVLFHGLADSPYYLRSIAEYLYQQDYAVIVPLLPGHGKLDADADMQDPNLKQRWYAHVDNIMALAANSSEKVFVGGFSAGGTLATHYMLQHPSKVQGLLLFSGALELSSSAETMSSIWGMKSLAVWLDGTFETDGPNLYRYPKVASYSGLVLMDVIKEIREMLADKAAMQDITKPIFTAHSMADNITPFTGIEDLLTKVPGNHTQFKIDSEFDVCHSDVVLSPLQVMTMNFNKSAVNQSERCAVPKANPLHSTMLSVMSYFVAGH